MAPQVSRSRKAPAIFAATLDLLAERGYDGLNIEAVAARAGVNKTTIYRSWASKDGLLAAALRQAPSLELHVPDTGSLRGDLIDIAGQIIRLLTSDPGRRVAAVMLAAAPERPGTTAATTAFFADRLQQETVIFERAVERGELVAGTDPGSIMDLLAGALWFRVLVRGGPTGTADLAGLVDIVLDGVREDRSAPPPS